MSDRKYLLRARQVAVLGSSGDIAREAELAQAEACGTEIARR
jgi:predicted Rossmann-fold nucleotide-binding protein